MTSIKFFGSKVRSQQLIYLHLFVQTKWTKSYVRPVIEYPGSYYSRTSTRPTWYLFMGLSRTANVIWQPDHQPLDKSLGNEL